MSNDTKRSSITKANITYEPKYFVGNCAGFRCPSGFEVTNLELEAGFRGPGGFGHRGFGHGEFGGFGHGGYGRSNKNLGNKIGKLTNKS